MRSWKDIACASIGIAFMLFAHVYLHLSSPPMGPINGSMGPNESPGQLYPACDYWPNGIGGKPCVDSDAFERAGRLIFQKSAG